MDCIFCKIAKGEIPCHKIWEDDKFLAFLDIFPNIDGMTLVIPKEHKHSYLFENDDKFIADFMIIIKKIVKLLEKKLNLKRVGIIFEGTGVAHLHAKLYPMKEEKTYEKEKIYFGDYVGYLTTLMGPKADDEKLKKIANKIKE